MFAPLAGQSQAREAAERKVLVQPLRLRATLTDESSVHLNFSVPSEKDVLQYEIERSESGKRFKTVGLIFTAEDAQNEKDYSFTDELKNGATKLTYRVRIVKKDAKMYSETVEIHRTKLKL